MQWENVSEIGPPVPTQVQARGIHGEGQWHLVWFHFLRGICCVTCAGHSGCESNRSRRVGSREQSQAGIWPSRWMLLQTSTSHFLVRRPGPGCAPRSNFRSCTLVDGAGGYITGFLPPMREFAGSSWSLAPACSVPAGAGRGELGLRLCPFLSSSNKYNKFKHFKKKQLGWHMALQVKPSPTTHPILEHQFRSRWLHF